VQEVTVVTGETTSITSTAGVVEYVPPSDADIIEFKMWGAGGAGSDYNDGAPTSNGGGGGYTRITWAISEGETFWCTVGAQGVHGGAGGANGNHGQGGAGGVSASNDSGGGGSYSAVHSFNGSIYTLIACAGGGGGGGSHDTSATSGGGGAGAGIDGNPGSNGGSGTGGAGGTLAGLGGSGGPGQDGEAYGILRQTPLDSFGGGAGASGTGGGGGGGYGGGEAGDGSGSGGGGSGYADPSALSVTGVATANANAANNGDSDYITNSGKGGIGSTAAFDGLIVATSSYVINDWQKRIFSARTGNDLVLQNADQSSQMTISHDDGIKFKGCISLSNSDGPSQVFASDGSTSAPGISFAMRPDMGLSHYGADSDTMRFVTAGAEKMKLDGDGTCHFGLGVDDTDLGFTWDATGVDLNNTYNWSKIVFDEGNQKFVAANNTGSFRIATSSGGRTWTEVSTPATTINALASNNKGFYLATGISSAMYSQDGLYWILDTGVPTITFRATVWDETRQVFIGATDSGSNRVVTRTAGADGVWTSYPMTTASTQGMHSFGGTTIVVGYGAVKVVRSTDLTNWTDITDGLLVNGSYYAAVTFSKPLGRWLASGNGDFSYSDDDGITWTSYVSPQASTWFGLTWIDDNGGMFVAVAGNAVATSIMTSPTGIDSWTLRSAPETQGFKDVTYDPVGKVLCALANSGTNRIAVSDITETSTTQIGADFIGPAPQTTAERDALTPAEGWTVFNNDTGELNFYDGANWSVVSNSLTPHQNVVYADTTARDAAITSPAAGMQCFLTSLGKLQIYSGSGWETITSA
jgi:hypothetical protein